MKRKPAPLAPLLALLLTQPAVLAEWKPVEGRIMTKWANTPNHIRRPPPLLGEHNEEIYLDLLGYTREEYDALVAKGLVGFGHPESVVPRTWK